jgi:hypothetical protein
MYPYPDPSWCFRQPVNELPEFKPDALEVLRQPLEDGVVTIARVQASLQYPARFILAAAMNPCVCGYFGDTFRQCSCSPGQVRKYQQRISGLGRTASTCTWTCPSSPTRRAIMPSLVG